METAAKVDANGVLDTLVKQPYDNQPTEDSSGLHLEESFKGPYSKIRELLDHVKVGDPISAVYSTLSSYVGIDQSFGYPPCPVRDGRQYGWVCQRIRCQEDEAGDHAHVFFSYDAFVDGELEDDPYQDVWSITWQAYSVDPYNFLSNAPSQPYPCSPSFDTDPVPALPPANTHWSTLGSRAHIDKYLNSIGESKTVQGDRYYYYAPDAGTLDYRLFLNGAEGKVLEKKLLNRSATYHYPILVHQTVKRGSAPTMTYADELGGGIDHVISSSVPYGCPYTFPPNTWTFVKIGDEMTQVKTRQGVSFTRRETFGGYRGVDMNYYGNGTFSHDKDGIISGRWELESL